MQAVTKVGESEGRTQLYALCTVPAESVQDGWCVHEAMAMLKVHTKPQNEHTMCSFCSFSGSGHERVCMRARVHTSE